jgi:hypothetical protein
MAFTAELHATMGKEERGRRLRAVYQFLMALDIGKDADRARGVEDKPEPDMHDQRGDRQ